jgi:transcriptional regulator with XRE-family HTH domain
MDPQQARKLGRHLKQAREAIAISARELARRVGVPDSTIVRIEQGPFAEPSPETMQRIAEVLGLSLADLYVMADFPIPGPPALRPYPRTKFHDLPVADVHRIDAYAQRLAKRSGVNLDGPALGEDERQVAQPTPADRSTNKAGRR